MNQPIKLDCHITLKLESDKCSNLLGLFISYEGNEVLWIQPLGPYSQHYIFFITYESAHWPKLLDNIKLERLASDKHSNLLGLFISYKENEVLLIGAVLHNIKAGMVCQWETLKLIRPVTKKWSIVNTAPGPIFTTLYFLCNLWIGPLS
jgi:hypothetical protein